MYYQKLNLKEKNHLNILITSSEIETVIKNLLTKKVEVQMVPLVGFIRPLKGSRLQISLKLLPRRKGHDIALWLKLC